MCYWYDLLSRCYVVVVVAAAAAAVFGAGVVVVAVFAGGVVVGVAILLLLLSLECNSQFPLHFNPEMQIFFASLKSGSS